MIEHKRKHTQYPFDKTILCLLGKIIQLKIRLLTRCIQVDPSVAELYKRVLVRMCDAFGRKQRSLVDSLQVTTQPYHLTILAKILGDKVNTYTSAQVSATDHFGVPATVPGSMVTKAIEMPFWDTLTTFGQFG